MNQRSEVLPTIVVVAFNRAASLRRLLASLEVARYPTANINLIISLDYADTAERLRTREVALAFEWKHGEKQVRDRDGHLGLRKHVLACGDITKERDAVIMLEDDLSVGPEFYVFAVAALNFAAGAKEIGGISLYGRDKNILCRYPFTPVVDGYDNFYLQVASSWGQAWTRNQWCAFRNWYDALSLRRADSGVTALQQIPSDAPIPTMVRNWGEESWLKYFIWYLVEHDRYFLYPRSSHTTCHSEKGVHAWRSTAIWHVPVALRSSAFRFSSLSDALAVYDSFFELIPERLRALSPPLRGYDFDVDLYGCKQSELLRRPYVLTSKRQDTEPVLAFSLERKPLEANLQHPVNTARGFFVLLPRGRHGSRSRLNLESVYTLEYLFGALPLRTVARRLLWYYVQRTRRFNRRDR